MKKTVFASVGWLTATVLASTDASARPAVSKNNQGGTVLKRQRHLMKSSCIPEFYSPTDAAPQSEFYVFDIYGRIGCKIYTTRYESPYDFLPPEFNPNGPIKLRLAKYRLYGKVPEAQPMLMRVAHSSIVSSSPRGKKFWGSAGASINRQNIFCCSLNTAGENS